MVCLHLIPRCAKIRFYFNNGALMLGQSILSTGVVEMIRFSLAEQLQGAAAELFTAKRILPTKNNFSYYFTVQSILSAVILLSSVSVMI